MHERNGEIVAESLSTRELLSRVLAESRVLLRKEIALAKAEVSADLKSEARMAKALGAGALLGLCGLTLAFVTVILVLAAVMPAWLASLIVTLLVLATAGIVAGIGWGKRVRSPLELTRRHLRDDMHWMKERLA